VGDEEVAVTRVCGELDGKIGGWARECSGSEVAGIVSLVCVEGPRVIGGGMSTCEDSLVGGGCKCVLVIKEMKRKLWWK